MIEIEKPTAIVDEKRVRKNIERMANKAKKSDINFRPHFKTHQSADIGRWFRDYGVNSITVSSVDMANYFADHGWTDITIAVPVNIKQINHINKLAGKISINLLVENLKSIEALKRINHQLKMWIEIDIGYHRTGVNWQNTAEIENIVKAIDQVDNLHLSGILTHAGHAYHANSVSELKKIFNDSVIRMNYIKEYLLSKGYNNIKISVGDTPTCSVVDDFSGVDEIRPGNFVFYDLIQVKSGACEEKDIALVVGCPIIAKYPERNELVIYGGGVHLSKDFIVLDNDLKSFGKIALPTTKGWSKALDNAFVTSVSQEHGIIKAKKEFIAETNIGDILMVFPIHSCLTANLHHCYQTVEGQNLNSFIF
ncbi:MAG: alanine racemase [Promethearchaeota archaeon]